MAKIELPSDDVFRSRFKELREEIAKIEAKAMPLREERDNLVNNPDPRIKELEGKYLKIEEPLAELKRELSRVAGYLKGKTGDPAEVEAQNAAIAEAEAKASKKASPKE